MHSNENSSKENQVDNLINQDMNKTLALLTEDEISAVGGGKYWLPVNV
jgi:hypothetical protein